MQRLKQLLVIAALALGVPAGVQAQEWGEFAYISSSIGVGDGRVCAGEYSRGAIGCASNAPYISRATGNLGIGTTNPQANLEISATASTLALNYANVTGHFGSINFKSSDITRWQIGGFAPNYNGLNNMFGVFQAANAAGTPTGIIPFAITDSGNIGMYTTDPSTTLHVQGTLRIATSGAVCDANRTGAIKYDSGSFYVCQTPANGWEAMATTGANSLADRITSGSQAGVIANATGFISLTTGGVTGTVYFNPAGVLVNRGISTTSTVSATNIYLSQSFNGLNEANLMLATSRDGLALHADSFATTIAAPSNHLYLGTSRTSSATDDVRIFTANSNGTTYPLIIRGSTGNVGINNVTEPSTTLSVNGTLRLANGGETCDTNRRGAIKYEGSDFFVCRDGANWETLVASSSGTVNSDRITSGTTQVITRNNTSITLATAGVERVVVGTNGKVGIGSQPSTFTTANLTVSGSIVTSVASEGGSLMSLTASGTTDSVNLGLYGYTKDFTLYPYLQDTAMVYGGGDTANLQLSAASATGVIRFTTGGWNNGTSERMRITSTGGVGIGTPTPFEGQGRMLHLYNDGPNTTPATGNTTLLLESANRGANVIINALNGGGIIWRTGDMNSAAADTSILAWPTLGLSFTVSGTQFARMRDGMFGVGPGTVSAPSATLHVGGSIRMKAETSPTLATCTANRTGAIKYESGDFHVCRNGTAWESLTGLTDGSTSASDRITSGTAQVITRNNTSVSIITAGAERLTIGVNGKIGIGTNSPTSILDIVNNGTHGAVYVMSIRDVSSTGGLTLGNGTNTAGLYAPTIYGRSVGAARFLSFLNEIQPEDDTGTTPTVSIQSRILSGGSLTEVVTRPIFSIRNYLRPVLEVASSGNIGIGTTAPESLLHVSGTGYVTISENGATHIYRPSTGSTNLLNVTSDNGNVLTVRANGYIGIGLVTTTVPPSASLHVSGTIRMSATAGLNCDANRTGAIKYQSGDFHVCRNGSAWESLTGLTDGSTAASDRITSGTTQVITRNNTSVSIVTAGTERVVVGTAGNVGIAQQPATGVALAVSGSMQVGSSYANMRFVNAANGGTYNYIQSGDAAGTQGSWTGLIFGNWYRSAATSIPKMIIDSSGNVGINLVTPSAPLHVSGSAIFGNTDDAVTNDNRLTINSNGYAGLVIGGDYSNTTGEPGGAYIRLNVDGRYDVSTTQGGIISIINTVGTDGHGGVYNGTLSNAMLIGSVYDGGDSRWGALQFGVSRSVAMTISKTGNVGIGTNDPSTTLHIIGRTRINADASGFMLDLRSPLAPAGQQNWSILDHSNTGFLTIKPRDDNWNALSPNRQIGIEHNTGNVALGIGTTPTVKLHLNGAIRLAYEVSATRNVCDADRTGAIKYESGDFHLCRNGTAWESLTGLTDGSTAAADRIVSGTTQVITRNNTSVSIVTAGTERVVVGTTGNVGIGQQPTTGVVFSTSGTSAFNGFVGIGTYSPLSKLHIQGEKNYNDALLRLEANRESVGSAGLDFYRSRGTTAAPTALQNADYLGAVGFTGYDGTAYQTAAQIRVDKVGSAAAGQMGSSLMFFTRDILDSNISARMTIANTGNVGIGTTTPSETLHLYTGTSTGTSADNTSLIIQSQNRSASLQLISAAPSLNSVIYFSNGNNQNTAQRGFIQYTANSMRFGVSETEAMRITTSGNVGISTSTPSSSLHVVGGEIQTATSGAACNTTRAGAIRYTGGNLSFCNGTTWNTLDAAGGTVSDRITSGTTQVITRNNTSVSIVTAGTERVVIGTNGNIGIGQQPNNSYGLSISGSTIGKVEVDGTAAHVFTVSTSTDSVGIGIYGYTKDYATPYMRDTAMIYATNDTANLQLTANSSTGVIRFHTGGFSTEATERMRIASNGFVGISTTNPSQTLTVDGVFSVTNPGSTPKGSSLSFTSPQGNVGVAYVLGDGTGGMAGRWVTAVDPFNVFYIQRGNLGTSTGMRRLDITPDGRIGMGTADSSGAGATSVPSTTLHVVGSIRMAAETSATYATCTVNRTGAMKYESGDFFYCRNGTTWESLTSLTSGGGSAADRITSGTTQVITRNNTSVSIVTAGTERVVVGTNGNIGIGQQPGLAPLAILGTGTGGLIATLSVSTSTDTTGMGFYAYTKDHVTSYLHDTAMIYTNNDATNLQLTANSATGVIRFHTGGFSTVATERMRIDSAGNIGIGTTAPSRTLHIAGSSSGGIVRIDREDPDFGGAIYLNQTVGGALTGGTLLEGNSNAFTIGYDTNAAGAYSPLVTITSTGLAGLGTTAPSETLHMYTNTNTGTAADNTSLIVQSANRSSSLQLIASTPSFNSVIYFSNGNNQNTAQRGSIQYTGNSMRFGVSETEAMRIVSTGLVGIGTIAPSSSLHVVGGEIQTSTSAQACTTARAGAIRYTGGNLSYCNGTTWSTLGAAGGTNADRIVSGTTQVIANQNTSVSIVTAGTERVVVGTNGNVGIAQQPDTNVALAVSGTVRVMNSGPLGSQSGGSIMLGTTNTATAADQRLGGYYFAVPAPNGIVTYPVGITGWSQSDYNTHISGYLAFETRGLGSSSRFERMRIDSMGNVGISTTNPTAKLEVAGRTSTTTIQLSNNPADACTAADYGTMKMINGRPYVCRP